MNSSISRSIFQITFSNTYPHAAKMEEFLGVLVFCKVNRPLNETPALSHPELISGIA